MGARVRFAMAIACAVALACMLGACTGSASSSASGSSDAPAVSAPSSSLASPSSSQTAAPDAKREVTIGLDYSAGTGYEWTYAADPEGVVELVSQTTEDRSGGKDTTGGPLSERFTFRSVKPGEVVLTFNLERSWEEDEPAETQVYAFTVNDNLDLILNPYKSDFVNEPE